MKIDIGALAGGSVLSGAVNGKSAFARLVSIAMPDPEDPEPLFIDFSNVEVATASFLRESVLALKSYMRTSKSNLYPVAANINQVIKDELLVVVDAKNDTILICRHDDAGHSSDAELVGELDPKQQMTYSLVLNLNGADATSLMQKFGAEEKMKSATAWNNRLAGLVARGVVREFSRGRTKFYRPMFDEVL